MADNPWRVSHLALEKPWDAWLRSGLELSASQVLCQAELQPQLVEPLTYIGFMPILPIDVG